MTDEIRDETKSDHYINLAWSNIAIDADNACSENYYGITQSFCEPSSMQTPGRITPDR